MVLLVLLRDHKMITVSGEHPYSRIVILLSSLLFSFLVVDRLDQGSSISKSNEGRELF